MNTKDVEHELMLAILHDEIFAVELRDDGDWERIENASDKSFVAIKHDFEEQLWKVVLAVDGVRKPVVEFRFKVDTVEYAIGFIRDFVE
jgi:hypothetical protein